jgi:hypothetical protein
MLWLALTSASTAFRRASRSSGERLAGFGSGISTFTMMPMMALAPQWSLWSWVLRASESRALIIPLIIQTIRRDPSRPAAIDEAPNLSRADPSGADHSDAEHQATDLAVRGFKARHARREVMMATGADHQDRGTRWDRPGARWLIDGMNLIGSRPDRWWKDPDRAVRRLIQELDRYAAATGEDVTVVFDRQPPDVPSGAHGAAMVAFASWRGRDAADHEIVRMLAEDRAPQLGHGGDLGPVAGGAGPATGRRGDVLDFVPAPDGRGAGGRVHRGQVNPSPTPA